MNTRSRYKVFMDIFSDILCEVFEAIGSTSFSSVYLIYAELIKDCDPYDTRDPCSRDILHNKILISLIAASLTFFYQLYSTIKPQIRRNFLSKLWNGAIYTAEMHSFMLDFYVYLQTLIKSGPIAGQNKIPKTLGEQLSKTEFITATIASGSLALLSNSDLRNYWQRTSRTRGSLTKFADGFFGGIEGLAAGEELVSSFQFLYNTILNKSTSIYSPLTLGFLFGTGGLYGIVLGSLFAIHSPPEVTANIFSQPARPVALGLKFLQNLIFAIVFGISFFLDANNDGAEHRNEHIIEVSVLLGLYILKSIISNCCFDRRYAPEVSSGEDSDGDDDLVEGSGYRTLDFSTFMGDAEEEYKTPSPMDEYDISNDFTSHSIQSSSTASVLSKFSNAVIPTHDSSKNKSNEINIITHLFNPSNRKNRLQLNKHTASKQEENLTKSELILHFKMS